MAGSGFLVDWLTATGGLTTIDLHEAVTDPGANNDDVDTAAIGKKFNEGDLWLNTVSGVMWVCMDNATGAAVWNEHVQSESTPADNSVVRFDGTDGVHIQNSAWSIDDAGILGTIVDAAGNIGQAADNRPANIYAATSLNIGNGGFTATSSAVLGASGAQIRVDDVNLDWTSDGGGNIGAAAANRPANVYAATSLNVANSASSLTATQLTVANSMLTGTDLSIGAGGGFTASSSAVLGASGASISINDKNLLFVTDSGGNIGAAAANRPANVYAATSFNVANGASSLTNATLTVGTNTTLSATSLSIGTGGFTASSSAVLGASGASISIDDKNLLFVTDSGGNIGAAANNRPANVYAATSLNVANGASVLTNALLTVGTNTTLSATALSVGSGGFTASSTAVLGTTGAAITIDDKNLLLTTDSGGNLGAAADNRFANIYAATSFNVANGGLALTTGAISASIGWSIGTTDTSTGLGATTHLTQSIDQELALVSSATGRDIADGIVIASVFDRNAASITNAATVRIHSFGWTDNTDTYNELAYFTGSGALVFTDTDTATVTGDIADSATAVVHKLDSSNTMSTAGATLLSVQNNGIEKFYIDKDGDVVSDTEMNAAQYIWAGSAGAGIYLDANTGGVGVTGRELRTESISHVLQLRSARTSGSGNISVAVDADVNAASINAAHEILSVGWINNSDTRTALFEFLGNGSIWNHTTESATGTVSHHQGTADAGLQTKIITETLSPSAIETNLTTPVPAGCTILAVLGNCDSALTGGSTTVTWSLGTAADPDKYGTAGYPASVADSLAQNSKSSWTGAVQTGTGTEQIVLTGAATGGAADGDTALTVGSVKVVVIYHEPDALPDA